VIDVGNDGHVTDLSGEVHKFTNLFDSEVDHVLLWVLGLVWWSFLEFF
jgi:hypothetical protein